MNEETTIQKLVTKKCHFCKEKSQYTYEEEPTLCPNCGERYWNKPPVEIKLHTLQDKWFETKKREYLDQLIIEIHQLSYNIICGKLKSSGKYLDQDAIYDMVHFTIEKMMRYYLEKPEWKVFNSFTEYVSQVVLYPLYNKKDQEKEQTEISFYTPIGNNNDGGKETLLIDRLIEEEHNIYTEDYYLRNLTKEQLIDSILSFLKTMIYVTADTYDLDYALRMLTIIYHYFTKKNKTFFDNWWSKQDNQFRTHFEYYIYAIKQHIEEEVSV